MKGSKKKGARRFIKTISYFLSGLWLALSLTHCANPISPTGGPRDERAPRIDSVKSTANLQTKFNQNFFELTFDEWVVLKDVREQVIVSPPLDFELTLKKKTVLFEVKEGDSLRANTTYTVNFGEAVQDLTEGNPAEDLRFVFSTGDVLDSLSIEGQLFDIITREPVEDAYFMLYDNVADSVVRTQRPYYFGQTNEEGRFTIQNLRGGTFKGFALVSSGISGYTYNGTGEQIGFPDSFLVVEPGNVLDVRIPMFIEEKELRFFNADSENFGLVKLLFNQPPPDAIELVLPDSVGFDYLQKEVVGDTLLLWYNTDWERPWQMLIKQDTILNDTVNIPGLDKEAFLNQSLLQRSGSGRDGTTGLAPQESMEIEWNYPLQSVAVDRIQLLRDSIALNTFSIVLDTVSSQLSREGELRKMQIRAPLQQDSMYRLLLLPGAINDVYGNTNLDTIDANYKVGNLEDFGNIRVKFTDLDSTIQYLGELRQGNVLLDTFYIDKVSSFQYEKQILQPRKYTVRLIEDLNGNRKWDTGSYDLKRQPESIYTKELEQLRANWDQEEDIRLPDLQVILLPPKPGGGR